MTRISRRFAALTVVLLLVGVFATVVSAADEALPKPRVKMVLANAERVMGDLAWIVATLAQEKGQWENNVFPSLDIFLLGVDREKPIRFDVLVGGEEPGAVNPGSYRFQPSIPIENNGRGIRTFIDQNLVPIGINVRQKSRGGYYQLQNVYIGWMRMVDDYACIGTYESDVPKGMPHPSQSHKELIARGYDVALELNNEPAETQERVAAFAALEANMLDATKPREGESDAVFALRKGTLADQLERFGHLFAQAKRVTIGWTTDVESESGRADVYGEALPETDLAKFISMISSEQSVFAALPMPEDPAASMRLNLPFDEFRKQQLSEWYALNRTVAHEKIDANDALASSEKAPSKQISDLVFDMLTEGLEVGRLDAYADMVKTEAGPHVIVAGVRSADGKQADAILKLIPEAHRAWQVEMDVESVGATAIHKIDISGDLPKSLIDTFGDSGAVYVGTSTDLVWIAGGEGSLERLKETIVGVNEAQPAADVPPHFGEFKAHTHTLLKLYDSLVVELGWNPLGQIQVQPQGGRAGAGQGAGLQPIDPAELRDIATRATEGIDDRISGQARRVDNHVEGEILVSPGILRAVGKIIAKIAADNL